MATEQLITAHKFHPISETQYHLCGVVVNGQPCAYPSVMHESEQKYTQDEEDEAARLAIASGLGVSEWPSFLSTARERLATAPPAAEKATPRPWRTKETLIIDADGLIVADTYRSSPNQSERGIKNTANAELIVRAVNQAVPLAAVVEALKDALPIIERADENQYCPECATEDERWHDQLQHHYGCRYIKIRNAARAALAEVEGLKGETS